MIRIENERLKVDIKEKGAEISSICDKQKNREVLWQGNAKFWTGQAPILFPIVGELKNGKTQINGTEYAMRRHGFIRKMEPSEVIKEASSATFVFNADENTKKQYPFNFTFKAKYIIDENSLINEFEVVNNDEEQMPFNIGGHPAFALDFDDENSIDDYTVVFEQEETSQRHFINDNGLYTGERAEVFDGNTIHLTESIFMDDALVFKDLKSRSVSIQRKNGDKLVSMNFKGWPFFGVWSKPKAPYICLEPWIGCADKNDTEGVFLDKELMMSIGPNTSKSFNFTLLV